jgi:cysteine-rich repeat protein
MVYPEAHLRISEMTPQLTRGPTMEWTKVASIFAGSCKRPPRKVVHCLGDQDTPSCDDDGTLPACGDGHTNDIAGENCDDGNTTDDGNGCSSDCTHNNVCGNTRVEVMGEQCDDGGVDTARCNSDCSFPNCGDFHVNRAAGEECDEGFENGNGPCGLDCKLVVPAPARTGRRSQTPKHAPAELGANQRPIDPRSILRGSSRLWRARGSRPEVD